MGALDDKLVWLDEFNKNIIDYDKVARMKWILPINILERRVEATLLITENWNFFTILWSFSWNSILKGLNPLLLILIQIDKAAQICTELEGIVKKDRADLDALIKPPNPLKSTDRWASALKGKALILTFSYGRLVQAMDLADDIRAQEEISTAKQDLWSQGLAPEGKENTDEAKAFVKRMTDVATTLAALIKEADGEAAKYGQDIVLLAAFTNAQK